MKKIVLVYGYVLSVCALVVAEISANFCPFVFHQPKIPESVKKLRKK